MIGLFKIDNITSTDKLCVAHSLMTPSIKGRFYIPFEYRNAVSTLASGDRVFGVLDDASGYGAILYKVDDGLTDNITFSVQNNVSIGKNMDVKGQVTIMGNTVINNNLTTTGSITSAGTITSPTIVSTASASTITLTADNCAAIVAGVTGGTVLAGIQIVLA